MHSVTRRLTVALLLLLAGIAPTLASEAADRAALEMAAQAWIKAFNAGDTKALLGLATEDVVVLDPNLPPASGREAVRRAWEQAFNVGSELSSASKEIVIAGDVAWRLGALARRQANTEVLRSQSLEIWKRVSGAWKLHRQMSANLLTPPQLPRPPISEPVLDPVDPQPTH
jgi:ketosteroid isomerase-like protein